MAEEWRPIAVNPEYEWRKDSFRSKPGFPARGIFSVKHTKTGIVVDDRDFDGAFSKCEAKVKSKLLK